jgi:16S rRNA (cytidine1402-2'-O)-methyltransferase
MHDILGDRPMAVTLSNQSPVTVWRGSIAEARDSLSGKPAGAELILVIGGARGTPEPWDEERLQAELLACLDQGLGAKEASRQLAAESGWPRRDIYRMAVGSQQATSSPTKGGSTNAGSS